MKNFPKKNGVC
jgi:hypothetical protein